MASSILNLLMGTVAASTFSQPAPVEVKAYSWIKNSSAFTIGTSYAVTGLDTEVHDELDVFSSSLPGSFTIPATLNGRIMQFSAAMLASINVAVEIFKNGASFAGVGRSASISTGECGCVVTTGLVVVATGDVFSLRARSSASDGAAVAGACWFLAEEVRPEAKVALLTKAASQTVPVSSEVNLTLGTVVFDGHDFSTPNTNRITIPSGLSGPVRISGGMLCPASANQSIVNGFKNNIGALGLPYMDQEGTAVGAFGLSFSSAPLAVVPSDYFTLAVYFGSTTAIAAGGDCWLSIEQLPSDLKYALVSKSGSQTATSAIWNHVTFANKVADVGGWFDTAKSTRLTVPAGVSKVRLHGNVERVTGANQALLEFIKNGSSFVGNGRMENNTTGGEFLHIFSAIIDVVEGDYFELAYQTQSSSTIAAGVFTWFSIEAVG